MISLESPPGLSLVIRSRLRLMSVRCWSFQLNWYGIQCPTCNWYVEFSGVEHFWKKLKEVCLDITPLSVIRKTVCTEKSFLQAIETVDNRRQLYLNGIGWRKLSPAVEHLYNVVITPPIWRYGVCYQSLYSGVKFTKALFVTFFVYRIFNFAKVPVRSLKLHSYLTGVSECMLRRRLLNINAIFNRNKCVLQL